MVDEQQQQQLLQRQAARDRLREGLRNWGALAQDYTDEDLDKLWEAGYWGVAQLERASREGLDSVGLLLARVEDILFCQREDAGSLGKWGYNGRVGSFAVPWCSTLCPGHPKHPSVRRWRCLPKPLRRNPF